MKSYESYIDSGVPWLKDIPSHWSVFKFKHLFRLARRPVSESDKIVTAFRDGEVTLRENRRTSGFTNSVKEIGYQGVRKGDLVVHAMDAFAGAIGVSDSDGKCTPVYSCCIPNDDALSNYYADILRVASKTGFIESLSRGIRERSTEFRWNDLAELVVPVPPQAEQQKISTFLVREIIRIDTLINEKQNFINLLEEKRQALISHVVTKGLDDSVEMTDSGIEWIGEVPAHWVVMRMKHVSKLNAGTKKKQLADDEVIEFLPMSNVDEVAGKIRKFDMRKYSEVSSGYTAFQTNDVIFAKITPCMENGNCVLVPELKHGYGFGSTEFIVFRANKKFLPEYLFYVLRNKELRKICETFMTGTAGQQRISTDFLAEFPVAVPSINEQKRIVEHIRKNNARLYELKQETTKSIELLKEHRAALISAAVTGKIDVREEV